MHQLFDLVNDIGMINIHYLDHSTLHLLIINVEGYMINILDPSFCIVWCSLTYADILLIIRPGWDNILACGNLRDVPDILPELPLMKNYDNNQIC